MSTKMFILKASCLISSQNPPLPLNSGPMGKENNQGFELEKKKKGLEACVWKDL